MILASYNVENLFQRAIAMNQDSMAVGRDILENVAKLNGLFGKLQYTATDKKNIIKILAELDLEKSDSNGKYVLLRQNKGSLVKRPKKGPLQIVASGRSDWIGWVELKRETVNETAVKMTAQVIRDIKADILAVIEAEDRPSLVRFSKEVLSQVGGTPFSQTMLIDGNDDRGIDVGIMLQKGYAIQTIRSHVDDNDATGVIFSRDCPEYTITTPAGNTITVLINHLKSKGYGSQDSSDKKRKRQAERVRELYNGLIANGQNLIAIVGDFNDTPDRDPLAPLIKNTDLKDISVHPQFSSDGRSGTYANGSPSQKIDYILLSPQLFDKVKGGGIFRKGVWGGTKGTLFEHYPEITKMSEAASDHAAIWADIDI